MSKKSNQFSPEVRERAVRMVREHRGEYPSLWAAIESIDPNLPKEERLQAAVEANVRHTMKVLLSTPEAQSSTSGIRLVGALYDIDTGRVSFLD